MYCKIKYQPVSANPVMGPVDVQKTEGTNFVCFTLSVMWFSTALLPPTLQRAALYHPKWLLVLHNGPLLLLGNRRGGKMTSSARNINEMFQLTLAFMCELKQIETLLNRNT